MKTKVEKIVISEDDPELASGVLVNEETLPADLVIMGMGVSPATDFLQGSGIEIEKDGGVRVDEYLRVRTGPDTQDVYAIGGWLNSYPARRLNFVQVTLPFTLSFMDLRSESNIGMQVAFGSPSIYRCLCGSNLMICIL